jgi:hypothetical protein
MAKLKRSFVAGIMNKDLDERLIPADQFRDALNVSIGISESSDVGAVENTKGNTNISTITFPVGINQKCVGAVSYPEEGKIFWFIASDANCYIYEFDEVNDVTTKVLEDDRGAATQVLNLQKDWLITGVNYYDGFLYWTDDYNPPRKIHVGNAKTKTQASGASWFNEDDLNVIVKPPLNAPSLVLFSTNTQENNLSERFIQFAYRYKYDDDNYSSLSSFSATAFYPGSFSLDYVEHINEAMVNSINKVQISYNTGTSLVKEIQLVFRESRSTNIYIVENINKADFGYIDNDSQNTFFDNSKIYSVLPEAQLTRLFDNVPLKAKAQEIIGERLVYGNYLQFRDLTRDGESINLNYTLSLEESTAATTTNPMRTFRSDRDYEVGIAYLDDYGRMTTVLTTPTRGNVTATGLDGTLYIPSANSVTANDIKFSIDSLAPDWATYYRLFMKQKKGDYYCLFPMYFVQDGIYRWFQISVADRDKFAIGDYLICKSNESGPSLSNTQYKVLDIKMQEKDFLGNGEAPGLYFKIGVEGDDFKDVNLTTITSRVNGAVGPDSKTWNGGALQVFNTGTKTDIVAHCQNVNDPIAYLKNSNNKDDLSIVYPSPAGVVSPFGVFTKDDRITIKIVANTSTGDTFEAYNLDGDNYEIDGAAGSALITGAPQTIGDPNSGVGLKVYKIQFLSTTGHTVGDRWVINVRAKLAKGNKTIGGATLRDIDAGWGPKGSFVQGGWAVFPDDTWGLDTAGDISNSASSIDRPIYAGAQISFSLYENNPRGKSGSISTPLQEFTSSRNYDNIEEWFYEDNIYRDFVQLDGKGTDVGNENVLFRRTVSWKKQTSSNYTVGRAKLGTNPFNPIRMIIQGKGMTDRAPVFESSEEIGLNNTPNFIRVKFSLKQTSTPLIFETDPIDNDIDVFHELYGTYVVDPVTGYHNGNTQNQAAGVAAEVSINNINAPSYNIQNNNFNAYTFGNGLESNRIKDDFNEDIIQYSPRVNSIIDDYRQERKIDSITWSAPTSRLLNNLNEFNLSTVNFKNLDISFGSIQKLYSRDTNLLVFQENKVSYVPWNKSILSTASGSLNVTQSSEVAGTQVSYVGEYGISNNPESFGQWGNNLYFTDVRRGSIMKLGGNGLFEISSQGMRDYFKDLFIASPRTVQLGAVDPYSEKYVMAHLTDTLPCSFSVGNFTTGDTITKTNAGQTFSLNISSDVAWAAALVGAPAWASIAPATGSGDGGVTITITANSSPGSSVRSTTIRFTACAVNTDITLTQQSMALEIDREVVTLTNPCNGGLLNKPSYDYTSNAGSDVAFTGYIPAKGTVGRFTGTTGWPPSASIPTPGDTVTLKGSILTDSGTDKGFNDGLNNKMYYLATDTEYTNGDTASLKAAASVVGATYNPASQAYEADFVYSRPSDEKYLYLMWDYTDNIPAGTTGCSEAQVGTSCVDMDYGTNIGQASLGYDSRDTPNRFVFTYNDVTIFDTGYVGLNTTANYNALIAAGVAAADISLVSPYTGTVNNGVGTETFSKYSDSITKGELTVYAPLATADGWCVSSVAPSLTSFLIYTTGRETDTDVCTDTAVTTYYHDGTNIAPETSNTIYTDAAGTTKLEGATLYYALGSSGPSNTWIVVNNAGMVVQTGGCSCAEVAIPVISTTTITLTENADVSYTIDATNNPSSWAIVSTCKEYSLFGGTRGAVFSGTHCSVAEAKVITVGGGNTTTQCFSGTTVSQLSGSTDATYSLVGVCLGDILPNGMTFDNGVLEGKPSESGEYTIRLTATNCFGTSVETVVIISVSPEGLFRFYMDGNHPQDTSSAACALTAEYSYFYHNGDFAYPILNDRVFVLAEDDDRLLESPPTLNATGASNYIPYNGQDKWYLMDNNTTIKIARDGRVIDTYECIAGTVKVTEAGAGGFAPDTDKTTEGGSDKTLE